MKKYSRQREVILESIKMRRDHPTVDMLYEDLKLQIPNIGIATIYRNVSELCNCGQIRKIKCEDGVYRYDGNEENHIHFECNNCHRIFDIKLEEKESTKIKNELQNLANTINAEFDKQEIMLSGLCEKCKKQ